MNHRCLTYKGPTVCASKFLMMTLLSSQMLSLAGTFLHEYLDEQSLSPHPSRSYKHWRHHLKDMEKHPGHNSLTKGYFEKCWKEISVHQDSIYNSSSKIF